MAEKKKKSYFTFTNIEKRINKRLEKYNEEDCKDANAVFKKQLCALTSFYTDIMDALQLLKTKPDINKRKIERLEKDVKCMYSIFGITLNDIVKEHQSNLKEIRNFGKKQK